MEKEKEGKKKSVQNTNTYGLLASTEDIEFLNQLNDHNKYLPKPKDRTVKGKNYIE